MTINKKKADKEANSLLHSSEDVAVSVPYENNRNLSKNPNAHILDRLLSDIMDCTYEIGIVLWLECGTLLGFIRDRDYIPWEMDLDFGARVEDLELAQSERFKNTMEQLGYQVDLYESYWHIAVPGSECHADINLYTFGSDHLAIVPLRGPGSSVVARAVDSAIRIMTQRPLGLSKKSNRARDIWRIRLQRTFRWFPRPLSSVFAQLLQWLFDRHLNMDISWRVPTYLISRYHSEQFHNVNVFVPEQALEYLAYRYGDDWRVPRRCYDTWKEDGAIV